MSRAEISLVQDAVVELPTWFGPADRPLFGWLAFPRDRRVRGAVVVCAPLAEEAAKAARTMRRLSQLLAAERLLALRFDYDGTGDSAGRLEDPQRATAWTDSVAHAVAEVRRAGVDRVSVVGMRMGATIAYAAAAGSDLGLDDLVLWDPCASGRSFLREQQMVQAAWLAEGRVKHDGGVEVPSYWFSPEAADDTRALAIDGRAPADRLARRVTVLPRPDRTTAKTIIAALPEDRTTWVAAHAQDALLDVPTLDAVVPSATLAEVVELLSRSAGGDRTPIAPAQSLTAGWSEDGVPIVETIRLVGKERRLFAVESSPAAPAPGLPRVLFVNVAAERHIGSGRMWVTIGRQLARDGFVSWRLDQSGVGDSPTSDGRSDDEMFPEHWLGDVPAAARDLADADGAGVIGVGLCSSGISVLHAAANGALREAVAVNVELRAGPDGIVARIAPQLPRGWMFSRMPAPLIRLSVEHQRVAQALWRVWNVVAPRSAPLWGLRRALSRGAAVTYIVGPNEVHELRRSRVWRAFWGRPLRESPRFRAVHLPNADHSLRSTVGRRDAEDAILTRIRTYAAAPVAPQRAGSE